MTTLSILSWSLRSFVVLSVVVMIGVAGASAATVTWSDPIDASTNLPVNNGNVIEAVNSGGEGVTINDIEFIDGDFGSDIQHSNLVSAFPDCCSDNGAPTGADQDMEVMLDSHRWLSTGGEPTVATLALEGLEIGAEYAIQLYFSDFRPGDFKTYFWLGDAGGASESFTRNGPAPDNVSFVGTFTADADIQNVHLVPDGTRLDGFVNHDPGLSGYVLSAVLPAAIPEPGSMLLAGMAFVGVMAVRRRWVLRSSAASGTLFLGMVLVICPNSALAAEINWLPRIDASTNLPVNNGNVIEAVNAGGEEISINGIFFNDGGFNADTIFSNLDEAFPDCCSDNGAPTGADEDMAVMLDSHRWLSTGGKPTVATLVLENLAVDEEFMIQLYFSDFRPGSFKEYYWAGDNGSISELFTRGTTEDNWSFIGTFTADSDQQRIHLIPNGTRVDGFVNHDPGLSGYVLSIVVDDDPCDFDDDGLCNTVDIDLLGKEIIAGSNDPSFDVNGDGVVTLADQDQWRADAAAKNGFFEPYLNGDANLDGSVLVGDLNAVGTNWQSSPDPWSSGDFNADGIVDVADLNLLALNWQQSVPAAAAAATGEAVPEPSAVILLMLAATAGCLSRRRFLPHEVTFNVRFARG